ncbi:hypothetical protein [Trichococcus pasteurii]|uniref:Uncharacterized protein n=1 Tax=Trichococcus pasteurii TaxID=43064 RepID=A0A1W1IGZ2_9LACT|nr:hypothetical protein [Trichococcus pasteurii]SFE91289.1 hypothetical protein SAMN04488086_11499 [Trichococcus pasteurii]SLM52230.1 Hypothetical protein TPAS_1924 [Trichococcus pasteurii]SSB93111.1 Hypothetical protein TPAS_1924 [Trichococcus pasteurii]
MDTEKVNVYTLFTASLIMLAFTLLTDDLAISMVIAAIAFPAIRSLIKNYRKRK